MISETLYLTAPAKINLYLKVIGKRPDGYHELNTLMQKLALFDKLEMTLVDEPGIHISCPGTDLPVDKKNIVHRAANLFFKETGTIDQGIQIILKKNIPVAAGLGGGSSDAATVLTGLNRLLATQCSLETLADMGVRLGADVPVFVYDMAAAWATGIGEKLKPVIPLSGYRALLVNPGIAVSTKWVFETFALTGGEKKINLNGSAKEQESFDPAVIFCSRMFQPHQLVNDLETVTAEKYPVISEIKNKMIDAGAAGAMMSGSGSTVFGLFADSVQQQAEQSYQAFEKEYNQVYLVDPLS